MTNGEGEYRRLPAGDGSEIGYHDSGHGPAIVLAHAGVFSDWFAPLSLQLPRDRFRVVRLRRAGYRDTTRPAGHLTLADHARHAAVLLDELGVGAAHWVGHSSSCLIGLQLAQDRPDLVASLNLLEPAPGGDLHGPADEQFVAATVRPAMQAFAAGDASGAFDRFMRGVGGPGYPAVLADQLGADGREAAQAESAFFFADELPAVREWVFGPAQAARVTQPALVVLGADSARLTPLMAETVQRLAAMLPHVRTQTLQGCTHLMPLQQPAALARLITAFTGSIPRPAPTAGATAASPA
ncbi:MAG: alpha/beta hydrolase [Streptosporangiaceae bacterium]|nr:alpha/beta hydrolase [Streptosporangiaceae bacterium]MBV9856841.1 alpha/beta hydrolase [Streptosporangiaceae bacterium]